VSYSPTLFFGYWQDRSLIVILCRCQLGIRQLEPDLEADNRTDRYRFRRCNAGREGTPEKTA
jgi:hypothetical protein